MAEFYEIEKLSEQAGKIEKELKKVFAFMKKKKKGALDQLFHELHKEAFIKYDCLDCGNCCKGLGPRVLEKDIDNIAKALKIKPGDFIGRYLRVDEDNDFVFKSMPCPFIGEDHYCHIYENRPKACRDYPHTDENKVNTAVFLKNIAICPVCLWIGMNILEYYDEFYR